MSIFQSLISSLKERKVKEVRVGFFSTAVVSVDKQGKMRCRIASTLRDNNFQGGIEAESLKGRNVRDVAALVLSGKIPDISIGMAALNSALPEVKYLEINTQKLIAKEGCL